MALDPRQHVRVHSGMPEHPKVEPLSDAAFRCVIEAWCLCRRTGNDGRMPVRQWEGRWKPKPRREVLAAGLAHREGDVIVMHDWLEHQPSAAELDAKRQVRAEAGRRGGKRSGEVRRAKQERTEVEANGEANASGFASPDEQLMAADNSENSTFNTTRPSTQTEESNYYFQVEAETALAAEIASRGEAKSKQMLEQMPKQTGSKVQPDKDKDKEESYVGGERPVSTTQIPAKNPPGNPRGNVTPIARAARTAAYPGPMPPGKCPQHLNDRFPPPCGRCADERRILDAWTEQRAAADRAALDAKRAAVRDCELCDSEGWRIPPPEIQHQAPADRCTHRPGFPPAWEALLNADDPEEGRAHA